MDHDELRHRGNNVIEGKGDEEEETEIEIIENQKPINRTPNIFTNYYNSLSERSQKFVIRTITTLSMISCILFLIYLGPVALFFTLTIVELLHFNEVINIAYKMYRYEGLILFRSLSWYFLFTSMYFFFGEGLVEHFQILFQNENLLQPLLTHHRFISYILYVIGFIIFVLILAKKHYTNQFALFGWTHLLLLFSVTTTSLMQRNIFLGIIWFMLPISLIAFNDIMAYVCGYYWGKTPLIKLSPRKTWEGFIGAAICTVICAIIMPIILMQFDYFVCPIKYDDIKGALSMECVRNPVFVPIYIELPSYLSAFLPFSSVPYYPFLKHSIIFGIFSSLIAPFGGFFASGFKRALKIKDFGDVFPGHGGITDRIDCQYLMGVFVYVYYHSFIKIQDTSSILKQVLSLSRNDQLEFYQTLSDALMKRGLI